MTSPREPEPVSLVISVFTADERLFPEVFKKLQEKFGEIAVLTEPFRIETDYYEDELGGPLVRKLVSFESLISPGDLSSIKLQTNAIEGDLAVAGKRAVNIDPGYVALEKLVLASCKNFSHRVCIGGGVYAEVTLIYERGSGFRTLEWTYPDYAAQEMLSLLNEIRKRLLMRRPAARTEKKEDG